MREEAEGAATMASMGYTACGGGNREKCDLIREHAHRFGGYFIFVPLFFYINRLWSQTTNFDLNHKR